ncbi:hypothetical protein SeI_A1196 [Salmonella enterica subsp. enterica serovar 4 [Salmonella enterica subsp. enterica serovar 4 [Salmonella enterica subsp. enterica serovar 4,[5],12:i:- str. CVM23701]|nr:hypothetical protein DC51_p0030 [Salmonella enterica subsp. enterica serovar Typhimurium]ARE54775.1 hypothetical protein FORC30_p017 [Salmonella enterica]EDZ14201.1 hypothetical protein SeI_A1196 [Salmonella enterica subsp. enterica serovar 4 [Salmonella enterica subsp. enterica serovar 4 [Salmonella enterica subsp. enterica serovar 4,[5],12:i:- str. CVM23701]
MNLIFCLSQNENTHSHFPAWLALFLPGQGRNKVSYDVTS